MGAAQATTTTTVTWTSTYVVRRQRPVPQQGDGTFVTSRPRRASATPDGAPAPHSSTTMPTEISICSWPLTSTSPRKATSRVRTCRAEGLLPAVGVPPQPARLFRNEGSGRFSDVTAASGIGSAAGDGLGWWRLTSMATASSIVCCERWHAESLWMNRGDGSFVEQRIGSRCCLRCRGQCPSRHGRRGCGLRRRRRRGSVRHQSRGGNQHVILNDGPGRFEDATVRLGLAALAGHSLASEPTSSTSIATGGSICSSPTAPSPSSTRAVGGLSLSAAQSSAAESGSGDFATSRATPARAGARGGQPGRRIRRYRQRRRCRHRRVEQQRTRRGCC